jgi:hypothetical protein
VPYTIYPQKKKRHKREVYVKKKKKYGGKMLAVRKKTARFDGTFFNFNRAKCIVFDREKKKICWKSNLWGSSKGIKKK